MFSSAFMSVCSLYFFMSSLKIDSSCLATVARILSGRDEMSMYIKQMAAFTKSLVQNSNGLR
jgi:hypothetical protein